jgi:hypothetical protein
MCSLTLRLRCILLAASRLEKGCLRRSADRRPLGRRRFPRSDSFARSVLWRKGYSRETSRYPPSDGCRIKAVRSIRHINQVINLVMVGILLSATIIAHRAARIITQIACDAPLQFRFWWKFPRSIVSAQSFDHQLELFLKFRVVSLPAPEIRCKP